MQPEEEFNLEERGATVDWDAEWKKVVKDQQAGKSVERPGEGYYKSEAEIAAIRAANKATEQMGRAASQMPSMPSFDSLKGDWKVCNHASLSSMKCKGSLTNLFP